MTNGYVYMLQSAKGGYYVGSTDNVDRRLKQHLAGHTHTTRRMLSLRLVFVQRYNSLKTARSIEARLKKLKRKDYIARIVSDGFIKISSP